MSEAQSRVGFIGLGVMGRPMALHLQRAGWPVLMNNRSRGVMDALVPEGLHPADSPAEVARGAAGGVIFLMLTDSPAVETVVLGESGLITGLSPGTLVIDMSTTALDVTHRCAAAVEAAGGSWVDAPVSGGEVGATEATLSIMAGGSVEDFARARPLFECLGRKVTHVGGLGAGQIAKLANQIIVAQTIAAIAEALTLAKAAGVDPAGVREAIRGGFAESRILAEHGERMVTGNFVPGGRARLQLKDVREAVRIMEEQGLELPMLRQNHALWEEMVHQRDMGDLDHSGLWRLYEARIGEL